MTKDEHVVDAVVSDLTERINDLETANEAQAQTVQQYSARVRELEAENHALRARLTAVALVIRP